MGAVSVRELKNMSDRELTALLDTSDSATRAACLMALSFRFQNPKMPVLLGPAAAEPAHSAEVAIPSGLLEKAGALAKSDSDLKVRLAAVMALRSFKFRTNTSPALNVLLEDRCCIIRIRAAQALIAFSKEYHERIPQRVIEALVECLDPEHSEDELWQAAAVAGSLGSRGREALPSLKRLQQHKSAKVRQYAEEAIARILKKSKLDNPRAS